MIKSDGFLEHIPFTRLLMLAAVCYVSTICYFWTLHNDSLRQKWWLFAPKVVAICAKSGGYLPQFGLYCFGSKERSRLAACSSRSSPQLFLWLQSGTGSGCLLALLTFSGSIILWPGPRAAELLRRRYSAHPLAQIVQDTAERTLSF